MPYVSSKQRKSDQAAEKTDIAGPDLYMSENKRKKFYEDIIFNPENYSNRCMVKFDDKGQWKMEKYEPSR